MPRKKRLAQKLPKGTRKGQNIGFDEHEEILQLFAVTGNKTEVARKMGITRQTVANHVRRAEEEGRLAKVRERALTELAGRVHGKALQVLDSITPADMESGRLPIRDRDGNLVGYRQYGPSLMQKVTSAAILTDKIKVLQDCRQDLENAANTGVAALPIPENVQDALGQIKQRISRLRILDLQFENKNPETASKLQDIAAQAGLQDEAIPADFEELDFDNPAS